MVSMQHMLDHTYVDHQQQPQEAPTTTTPSHRHRSPTHHRSNHARPLASAGMGSTNPPLTTIAQIQVWITNTSLYMGRDIPKKISQHLLQVLPSHKNQESWTVLNPILKLPSQPLPDAPRDAPRGLLATLHQAYAMLTLHIAPVLQCFKTLQDKPMQHPHCITYLKMAQVVLEYYNDLQAPPLQPHPYKRKEPPDIQSVH